MGAKTRWPRIGTPLDDTPFMEIDLPNEDVARDVAARAIGIKGIFEPWGSGATAQECLESIEAYPGERKAPYLKEESTFKINVCSYGRQLEESERSKRIQETFKHVDFKGKVRESGSPESG